MVLAIQSNVTDTACPILLLEPGNLLCRLDEMRAFDGTFSEGAALNGTGDLHVVYYYYWFLVFFWGGVICASFGLQQSKALRRLVVPDMGRLSGTFPAQVILGDRVCESALGFAWLLSPTLCLLSLFSKP